MWRHSSIQHPAASVARALRSVIVLSWLVCGATALAGVTPLGTAFTYQGRLQDGGSPSGGTHHLRFQLWNALVGGAQIGSDVNFPTLSISDGLFTVALDFGSDAFDGSARWLQVQVITNGGATITTLTPRQPFTATPYALQTRGIVVDAAGQVGIGTDDPAAKLHIVGDVWAHGIVESINPIDPTSVVFLGWGVDASGTDVAQLRVGGGGPGATNGLDIRGVGNVSLMRITGNGRVGIGTTSLNSGRLEVIETSNNAIEGISTGSSGGVAGVVGLTYSTAGYGVYGSAIADSGANNGVYGQSFSTTGRGVYGNAVADTGNNYGVYRLSQSTNGYGVYGHASNSMGITVGVWGSANSPVGYDFYAGGAGTNYGSGSSIRWKRNIELIDDPLGKVADLRGVYFDWDAEHGGHHDVGMITEEVGQVLPEIVNYEENGIDANGMDYSKLTPRLVEAVKALRAEKDAEIADQNNRIEAIEAQNAALQQDNQQLHDRLAALEEAVARLNKTKDAH